MEFSGNNIKSNFSNNNISTDFKNNSIEDNFQNNIISDNTNLGKIEKKEKKSLIELFAKIFDIIVGIIILYEFVLKHWFEKL